MGAAEFIGLLRRHFFLASALAVLAIMVAVGVWKLTRPSRRFRAPTKKAFPVSGEGPRQGLVRRTRTWGDAVPVGREGPTLGERQPMPPAEVRVRKFDGLRCAQKAYPSRLNS